MDTQELLEFIYRHDLCILSTVDKNGNPESAVVGFSENKDFELTVATSCQSRKYKNIEQNPHVSVVIGWDDNLTIQYEGQAYVLEGTELSQCQTQHFAKLPESEKYKDDQSERYLVIRPQWLRYTDCNQSPWNIT